MFREMRRKQQALSPERCIEVLERGTSGVLAVLGDGGYPYAVPLSYVNSGESILFHCAMRGHKLDAIAGEEKASFCVIDMDDVIPNECTTYFRSVIAFGRVRVIEDRAEKKAALLKLMDKYDPNDPTETDEKIEKQLEGVCMVELHVEHMTGKEARELVHGNVAEPEA